MSDKQWQIFWGGYFVVNFMVIMFLPFPNFLIGFLGLIVWGFRGQGKCKKWCRNIGIHFVFFDFFALIYKFHIMPS